MNSPVWTITLSDIIIVLESESNIAAKGFTIKPNWFKILNPDKFQAFTLDKEKSDLTNNQLVIDIHQIKTISLVELFDKVFGKKGFDKQLHSLKFELLPLIVDIF